MPRQIVALGGGGFLMEPDNPMLDDFVLGVAQGAVSRVCLLPTASGDSDRMVAQFCTFLGSRCRATHVNLFNRRHTDIAAILCGRGRDLRRRRQYGQHARHPGASPTASNRRSVARTPREPSSAA